MKEQLEHAINEFELQLMNNYSWYQEYKRILKKYHHLDKELTAIELYNIIKNTFYWEIQKDETMNILTAYNGDIEKVEGFENIQLYIDEDLKELEW